MKKKTVETVWQVWSYDVWGNAKEGYDVNDRSCMAREYPLTLEVTVHNAGTEREFKAAYPSPKQIREAFGVLCRIETSGDDTAIYVNRVRDGYPIGEMLCDSHESLSPIKAKV